jgi:Fe-S cluster biosynthesis and repair protein YggX
MADVQCVTCGQTGEPITDPLFMGKLETEIKAKVCKPCWKKWESMRVMVINEYQVNLGDESGRELVTPPSWMKIIALNLDRYFGTLQSQRAAVSSAKSPASLTCEIQKC